MSPQARCGLPALTLLALPLLLAAIPTHAQLEPRLASEVTAEATAADPRCPAQDAIGQGGCTLFLGYRWNGMSCEGISGCSCAGADCGNLFNTLEECQRKFCRCACEPMDARPEGSCEAILGWSWDGARCQQLVGCSCVGGDCDDLYGSQFDCETDHQACPCIRQDVTPVGLCEVILGWYWDGGRCDPLVGCSCSGPDCGDLFASIGDCQKAHLKCLCRGQDAMGEGPCRAVWGYKWTGEMCEPVTGCECVGFDCDLLSPTITECQALHQNCPCRKQDARGEGSCAQFFGYRWDGVECQAVNGCSCQGSDCDELFPTLSGCQDAHVPCPCRAQDATGVGGCALFHGWKWDGMSCVGVSGCSCSGPDCGNLFADLDACEKAHTDCDPCCGCNTCNPAPQIGTGTP